MPKKKIALKRNDIITFGVDVLSKNVNQRWLFEKISFELMKPHDGDDIIVLSSDDEDEEKYNDRSNQNNGRPIREEPKPNVATPNKKKIEENNANKKRDDEKLSPFTIPKIDKKRPAQHNKENIMPPHKLMKDLNDVETIQVKLHSIINSMEKTPIAARREHRLPSNASLLSPIQSPETDGMPTIDSFNGIIQSIINWNFNSVKATNFDMNDLIFPRITFETYENYKKIHEKLIPGTIWHFLKTNMRKYDHPINLKILHVEINEIGPLFICQC